MPLRIIVTVKQVIDPTITQDGFEIDNVMNSMILNGTMPSVVNSFDEYAVEAALRIKDQDGSHVTVISMGNSFAMEVVKKPLAMGADELILLQDPAFFNSVDSYVGALVLNAAINKIDEFDLIISGRQASDWDNGQVPIILSEMLGIPCINLGKKLTPLDTNLLVERIVSDGVETLKCPLPLIVTVNNECGSPRYPTVRGIITSSNKTPTCWSAHDIGINEDELFPRLQIDTVSIPVKNKDCEFIQGDSDREKAHNLALKLRESGLI